MTSIENGSVYSTLFAIDGSGNVIGNYPYFLVGDGDVIDNVQTPPSMDGANAIVELGVDGLPIEPILVLSSRGGNKIGTIERPLSIVVTHPLNEPAELSFDVYKEVNGVPCSYWDKIKDFKFIWIPYTNDWYEASVTLDEESDTVKHVTCIHANEAELSQLNLYETEINTENDISRDDYEETYFYVDDNPNASLLHRILKDKAPHYQIYHVDRSLRNLFRTFSFNSVSIHDALNQIADEVNCLFVYGEWFENDGKYHRTISAYDLEDYCTECHKRGNYSNGVCTNCGSTKIETGYGDDTGIFVSVENLTDSINYSTNVDNVKNCFRLVAGDDTMTAAVMGCNPNMSQYIWHFSEDMLEDMSDELRSKITDYQTLIESYKSTEPMEIPEVIVNQYNTLVDKYVTYNPNLHRIKYPILGTVNLTEAYYNGVNLYGFLKTELMPLSEKVETTTAVEQMSILTSDNNMAEVGISSVKGTIPYTSANSAIQSYAKVYIDTSRYKVSVLTTDINGTQWTGTITLTAYSDDEDTATETFNITLFDNTNNSKYTSWIEQKVQKAMSNKEVTDVSVVNLFKSEEDLASFKTRIKMYSLDYLNIMSEMATSAITVMTEQGVASQDSLDKDIYNNLYKPYYDKGVAIQEEIATREQELSYLLQPIDENGDASIMYPDFGLLDVITNLQDLIRKTLDLKTYLGDELWEELSYYRREDQYTNNNYISEGLTDEEIIQQAKQFYETAEKEIIKASTIQNSISASLKDFLLMPEFFNLQYKFKTGNWIHLKVDDKAYKLRLVNWTLDWSDIENLDVEFSDVVRAGDIISDVESILSKSKSIATSYEYTARQANKGREASKTLKLYHDNGIDFSQIKAISSKGNTNIVYDKDGILLKRVDDIDELPEQARIYNNGIYITRDAWETVSTGLGHFSYVDPETGETVETYGIIADTVIGRLILGENLKIYSQSNRFEMGDDGLVVTARDGVNNEDLFTIQKDTGEVDEDGKPIIEKYIYVDQNGNVNITGNSIIINGLNDSYSLDDARKVATNYLSADSSGIMVADMENGQNQTPSGILSGNNVLIDNTSVNIRDGQNVLSSFKEGEIVLGEKGKARLELTNSSIKGVSDKGIENFKIVGQSSEESGLSSDTGSFNNDATDDDYKNDGTIFTGKFVPNVDLADYEYVEVSIEFVFNNTTYTYDFDFTPSEMGEDGQYIAIIPPVGEVDTSDFVLTEYFDMSNAFTFTVKIEYKNTTSDTGGNTSDGDDNTGDAGSDSDDPIDEPTGEDEEEEETPAPLITTPATYIVAVRTKGHHNSSFTFGTRAESTVGKNSFTIGEELMASSDNQVAIGKYNYDNPNSPYAFMVGNGSYGISRSNALSVGWDGELNVAGDAVVRGKIRASKGIAGKTLECIGTSVLQGKMTYNGSSGIFLLRTYSYDVTIGGNRAWYKNDSTITVSGYKAIAIAGHGVYGDGGWCVFPRCYIWNENNRKDTLDLYIWNQKDSEISATVYVKIFYIARSTFGE